MPDQFVVLAVITFIAILIPSYWALEIH